ncbi:MAG: SH3 domain-containing protein, partial [Caldilineales bacterium]|nr:SH3 domain-containing protein [Caldilineales bacterium]
AQVIAAVVNVRSGPGTSHSRIGLVYNGATLRVIGRTSAGDWLQVCCVNNQQGWISADPSLVRVAGSLANVTIVSTAGSQGSALPAPPFDGPAAYANRVVNLRSGPGTAYPRAGQTTAGQWLRVVGRNADSTWWQVELADGKKAWVAASVVRTAGPVAQAPVPPDIPPPPAQAVAAAAPAAPRPSATGFFGYGIQINPEGDLGATIAAIYGLNGFTWVKFQLPWKHFEGQPGVRNWPDDWINQLHGAGLKILVSIVKAPDWARPANTNLAVEGPPADPATYASFVGEFAGRYCGRVQAIEVWNEQNLWREWGGEPLDPARYVRLLAAAYGAIKAACPSIIVVSGGLTPTGAPPPDAMDDFTYLERMYQAGLSKYANAIGAHPSGFNVAPDVRGGQEACNFVRQQGSLFMGPCHSPHHSWSFLSTLEGYYAIMRRYGDGHKQIWPTEFGWASGWTGAPGYEYANDNTLEEQAQWTVRAYQIMKGLGYVGPAFLWNLNYGVTHPGSELAQWGILGRPVYAALANMPK